jgi:diguanylate cyclase (GGDEF)-like protein/PAS domain S-box-containing protein
MNQPLPPSLLSRILELSPEGIAICDKKENDWLVSFVNPAFERLTGYEARQLTGKDLRLLQGKERDNESRQRIRAALEAGESCKALVRNYRNDGAQFWNEMLLEPVKDAAGKVTRYIGYHRDASERMRIDVRQSASRESFGVTGPTPSLVVLREDRLTGLYNKEYFEELLRRDWAIAQREQRRLSMMYFDIDALGLYNDTFGRAAGDSCIKRVARAIGGSLRRGSDLAARFEGGIVVTVAHGMDEEASLRFANVLMDRVREQHIHHPRCTVQRYVTVSAGVASLVPDKEESDQTLYSRVRAALKRAKEEGRNRAIAG